jgi:hypothetical protein
MASQMMKSLFLDIFFIFFNGIILACDELYFLFKNILKY